MESQTLKCKINGETNYEVSSWADAFKAFSVHHSPLARELRQNGNISRSPISYIDKSLYVTFQVLWSKWLDGNLRTGFMPMLEGQIDKWCNNLETWKHVREDQYKTTIHINVLRGLLLSITFDSWGKKWIETFFYMEFSLMDCIHICYVFK